MFCFGNRRKIIVYEDLTNDNLPPKEDSEWWDEYEKTVKYLWNITPLEFLRYKLFLTDHNECSNEGVTMSFKNNGIGNVITCTCKCGASVDITDYASW